MACGSCEIKVGQIGGCQSPNIAPFLPMVGALLTWYVRLFHESTKVLVSSS